MAFIEFDIHALSQQERGDIVLEDEVSKHSKWYIKWFYHVSPTAVPDYTAPVPPYKEVIVEQQWAKQPPDPFKVIRNIRAIIDSVAGVPDVYLNPTVARIMESVIPQILTILKIFFVF